MDLYWCKLSTLRLKAALIFPANEFFDTSTNLELLVRLNLVFCTQC